MKSLFKKNPTAHLRFVLLAVIAIMIMVVDQRTGSLQTIRVALLTTAAPIQYLVNAPVKLIASIVDQIVSRRDLNQENANLKVERLILKGQIQKFEALQAENQQLRALLQSSSERLDRVLVAHLVGVENDPSVQQITLSSGKRQKVYEGQPVLDANGVMGQVILVGPVTSQVLLITDPRSEIPVQDTRNGIRAVAIGGGAQGILLLANVPKTADIRVGDLITTSGLGKRFPAGYPIGKVSSVQQSQDGDFLRIEVTPAAAIYQTRLVLLLWPG